MTTHVTEDPYSPPWIWPIYFVEKPKNPVTEFGTWEPQPKPTDAGVVEALLKAGDALLFRGREHPHFREPLAADNRSYGMMLSHFVKPDYPIWVNFLYLLLFLIDSSAILFFKKHLLSLNGFRCVAMNTIRNM